MALASACPRLALAVLTVSLACRPAGPHDETVRTHVARMTAMSGTVDVLHAGAVDWVRGAPDAELYEDNRLRTFKSAWAQLTFDAGSSLRVDEESLITLGGGVLVERGSVMGELAAGLRLKTPAAEAETVPARDLVFR